MGWWQTMATSPFETVSEDASTSAVGGTILWRASGKFGTPTSTGLGQRYQSPPHQFLQPSKEGFGY